MATTVVEIVTTAAFIVEVILFNRCLKGFLEWYIIGDVPAIYRDMAFVVACVECLIVITVGKKRRVTPCISEVVF